MLLRRCDRPLLLAATRCAIDLAEVRGWSAATITGVFYGLKAVLDGHTGEDLILLSEVRQQVRPRSHSSATRVAEVLAELELLHDDTTAPIRSWIDRRVGELPTGFGRDVRAWLVMLLDGDAGRSRPTTSTNTSRAASPSSTSGATASCRKPWPPVPTLSTLPWSSTSTTPPRWPTQAPPATFSAAQPNRHRPAARN